MDLSWADVAGEAGYRVERSADGGATWALVGMTVANATSLRDAGVRGGATYVYRIQATNAAGASPYSDTATASTPDEPTPVGPPPHRRAGRAATRRDSSRRRRRSNRHPSGLPPPPTTVGQRPPTVGAATADRGAGRPRQRKGRGIAAIALQFSVPMDPATVADPARYDLRAGVRKRGRLVFAKAVKVLAVSYDETSNEVTLQLARSVKGPLRVVVRSGARDLRGNAAGEIAAGTIR